MMEIEKNIIGGLVLGILICWLGGFVMGYSLGYTQSTEQMTKHAIEHNAGYYDPKTSEFKWRELDEK